MIESWKVFSHNYLIYWYDANLEGVLCISLMLNDSYHPPPAHIWRIKIWNGNFEENSNTSNIFFQNWESWVNVKSNKLQIRKKMLNLRWWVKKMQFEYSVDQHTICFTSFVTPKWIDVIQRGINWKNIFSAN